MARERRKRIYDKNVCYTVLKYYVGLFYKMAYRKREYHGLNKIPKDGAVIFAPNHTNALMDALAVLFINKNPKVFVARADIFKKPLFSRILFFLKIMPINRIRDGRDTLKNNDETIQLSADVLIHDVPFVILPEGTHRPMHSLLPLGKGIFRIALLANEELQGYRPVYIVPMGIEYGNFFRYRSSLLMQIGDPINVTSYVAERPGMDQPTMMNELKHTLSSVMKDLILYIPDDEYYNATWELCNMCCYARLRMLKLKRTLLKNRLTVNKMTVADIQAIRSEQPQKAEDLLSRSRTFAEERKSKQISMASVASPYPGLNLFCRSFLMIILFPYFVACTVVCTPVMLVSRALCSKMEDAAFHNSVRYVAGLVVWTITFLILIIFLFSFLPWLTALIAALALFPAYLLFEEYCRWFRVTRSDYRWMRSKDLRKEKKNLVESVLQTIENPDEYSY